MGEAFLPAAERSGKGGHDVQAVSRLHADKRGVVACATDGGRSPWFMRKPSPFRSCRVPESANGADSSTGRAETAGRAVSRR